MNATLFLAAVKALASLPDTRDDVAAGTHAGPFVIRLSVNAPGYDRGEVSMVADALTVRDDNARAPSLPAADVLAVLVDRGIVSADDLRAAMIDRDTATKAGTATVRATWAQVAQSLPLATVRGAVSIVGARVVEALRLAV